MSRYIRSKRVGTAVLVIAAGGAMVGWGGSAGAANRAGTPAGKAAGGGTQLALVAYSTPKPAYDALTAAYLKTSQGRAMTFSASYGSSGSQSRAVASGQAADVVAFSTAPDMTRLVQAGIVAESWDANPEQGIVTDSAVVFVVRKGNPKHISGWADLVKPGIDVITPNPATSGSARWNILAAYGAQLKLGKTPAQALAYVRTLLVKHVSVQDSSGSAALQTFTSGKGDVLLSYESEAIAAETAGDRVQYIVPKQTILIQTPVAVTANSSHSAQAQAFVRWLWSPAAQTIWARHGYRPVVASVAKRFASKYPTPSKLFTIRYLGGWTNVTKTLFDPASGSITKIEQAAGVPTASG